MMERYERPIDDRIPFFWRREFKKFTGVEPTYEEYEKNPDLWKREPRVSSSIKGIMLLMVLITLFVYFILYLRDERKKEIKRAQKEFHDSKRP